MNDDRISAGLALLALLFPLQAMSETPKSAAASEPTLLARTQQSKISESGATRNADAVSETAADEGSVEEDSAPKQVEEPAALGTQTVTGSRLAIGDPTARVYSLTAEDIARRGVSSVEELMRTLPWTYPSITQQTSAVDSSALAPSDVDKNPRNVDNPLSGVILFGVITGFGTSTANLRALGSGNTLVLLNGRRIAGRAGDEEDFVNLLNVPLSAIERVDIQLDGGSAVYGADAIGGVVNFITRKNYTGASVTLRNDFSSTDADRRKVGLQGGFGWGIGQITGTLQRVDQKPIVNAKTGWTTNDHRSLFGPEFDDRDTTRGQPGVLRKLCTFSWGQYPCGNRLQLSAGHSGEGATEDDFSTDIIPVDYVPPENGEDASNTSLTLFAEHFFSDDFRVFADFLYSEHEAYQEYRTQLAGYIVPASNAFNPFGQDVEVNYLPTAEVNAGALPGAYHESRNEQRNVNAGAIWNLADNHQLEFQAARSTSENFGWQVAFVQPRFLPDFDPAKERVLELLASPDPAVAINLFGDGSMQSPELAGLVSPWIGPHRGITETDTYELLLRGQLFELWGGGSASYAAGVQIREKRIRLEQEDYSDESPGTVTKGLEVLLGLENPGQDLTAFFTELSFPIVGSGNARPGFHSLVLNLQARHDRYEASGAFGGLTRYRDENRRWAFSGEPNIITVTHTHTSPRIGLRYEPTEGLAFRAAWSESFRPPVFSDTFHLWETREDTVYVQDPYDVPGGPFCLPFGCQVRRVNVYSVGDDINPETSDNYSFSFDWTPAALPGLLWSVHWSKVDFTDKIEYSYNLLFRDPEVAFRLPEIVERDADGNAIRVFARQINLSEKVSEILTTELEYSFNSAWGAFTPRISYTRVLDEYFKILPGSEPVDRVGTTWGSNEYGLVASLEWSLGKYAADLFVRYTPGYENDRTGTCTAVIGRCERLYAPRPSMQVDSHVTVDLTASYRFDNGLRLRGGGRNVLDADPPATPWGGRPYDLTRYDARGQVLFVELNWDI